MAAATETHEIDMQVDDGLSDSYGRANLNEQGELDVQPKTDEEYAQTLLTLRAIVSSKEAGVIIGKAGKNVADLRDETGAVPPDAPDTPAVETADVADPRTHRL